MDILNSIEEDRCFNEIFIFNTKVKFTSAIGGECTWILIDSE